MTSATYKLFRRAILEEKQVTCVYNAHRRELCPHIIGHTKGQEKVLAFQFGGTSSSKLPPGGEWRCLVLANVEDVRLRGGPWHAGGSHSQQQRCVEVIDLDINVHVRPAREQRHARKSATTGVKLRIRKSPARESGSGEAARKTSVREGARITRHRQPARNASNRKPVRKPQ